MTTSELVLPRGVTGFFDAENPLPTMERKDVTTIISRVARAIGATFTEQNPGPTNNFFRYRFVEYDNVCDVVVNQHHALVALAEPSDSVLLTFVDWPELEAHLVETSNWRVLSVAESTASPTKAALAELAPVEIKQIQHWNPQRIGDIVFNFWD